jgi:hypothetical protein
MKLSYSSAKEREAALFPLEDREKEDHFTSGTEVLDV